MIADQLFDRIYALGLPEGKFMLLGSAVLGAFGIRPARDLDLLVTEELFERLKAVGWTYSLAEPAYQPGTVRPKVKQGIDGAVSIFLWEDERFPPAAGFACAQLIRGIMFTPLLIILEAKKRMARPKDLEDVSLIKGFLHAC